MHAVAVARRAEETEQALGKHMAGHTAEEFLRTITARDRELAELRDAVARTAAAWTRSGEGRLERYPDDAFYRSHRAEAQTAVDLAAELQVLLEVRRVS
jgi:hypothetical protein